MISNIDNIYDITEVLVVISLHVIKLTTDIILDTQWILRYASCLKSLKLFVSCYNFKNLN